MKKKLLILICNQSKYTLDKSKYPDTLTSHLLVQQHHLYMNTINDTASAYIDTINDTVASSVH